MSSAKKTRSAVPFWKHRAYERHRIKVKEATSAIDVNPPTGRPHVIYNAKGFQLERERQARIARDNFILLKKLRDIMYRKQRPVEQTQRLKWNETRCIRTR